jgi:probable F420-dependent oxidoreductase
MCGESFALTVIGAMVRGHRFTVVGVHAPTLSLQLRNFAADDPSNWQSLLDVAVAADRAGVDRIAVSDHVVFGNAMDDYADPGKGGTAGGRQPTGPDGHWLEPLTVLSVMAGLTSRVRLQTGVLLAALRRPAVLAKTCATLDVLSGGRLDLGVGVGWQRAEYDAAGLPFERRGELLDHTLDVVTALWTQQAATVASEFLSFDDIHAMPKPRQTGSVPILVSGTINNAVLRRVVRFGRGWIPWGPDVADPRVGLAAIRDAMDAAGRSMDGFTVLGTLPIVRTDGAVDLPATMAGVPALIGGGITDFRAYVAIPDGVEAATDYLADVVGAFRACVGS